MSELLLIFVEDGILLSKKTCASWRDIQAQYANFTASLGPWRAEEMIGWLDDEYDDLFPTARQQVEQFLLGSEESRPLMFLAARDHPCG